MKKLLLGTAAALTLTGPAQAGPALDALAALLPADARVSFATETVAGGAEVYEGLEVAVEDTTTRFNRAELSLTSGLFALTAAGARVSEASGALTEAENVVFSGPLALLSTDLSALSEEPEALSDTVCDLLSDPLRIALTGVRLEDGGRIGALRLEASAAPLEGLCALDFAQSMSGLDAVPPLGVGVRVAEQTVTGRAPVAAGLPEVATGEVFSSELSVKNAEVTVDGAPQVRVAEVRSRSAFDADSALPLVRAGYNRHLEALATGLAEGRAPEAQLPYADLWNGGRALSTEGTLQLTGLEVIGPALSPFSPVPGLLDPGARLDAELSLTKAAELLELTLKVDGSNTLLLDLAGAVRIEGADASFNARSPRALVMSAPLSFVSGSVLLSDRGLGAAGAQLLGADPYLMVGPALAGLIGETNAQSLSGWLSAAKDGGQARISADPAQPVPVLMLGMMGLGDWSALGAMLNVTR
jgi:hypothetical protein